MSFGLGHAGASYKEDTTLIQRNLAAKNEISAIVQKQEVELPEDMFINRCLKIDKKKQNVKYNLYITRKSMPFNTESLPNRKRHPSASSKF